MGRLESRYQVLQNVDFGQLGIPGNRYVSYARIQSSVLAYLGVGIASTREQNKKPSLTRGELRNCRVIFSYLRTSPS
jgi:hypothetical protein